jgi:hypothetical protein
VGDNIVLFSYLDHLTKARALHEDLIFHYLVKKFLAIYGKRKFHYGTVIVPILISKNPVFFSIILSSILGLPSKQKELVSQYLDPEEIKHMCISDY